MKYIEETFSNLAGLEKVDQTLKEYLSLEKGLDAPVDEIIIEEGTSTLLAKKIVRANNKMKQHRDLVIRKELSSKQITKAIRRQKIRQRKINRGK